MNHQVSVSNSQRLGILAATVFISLWLSQPAQAQTCETFIDPTANVHPSALVGACATILAGAVVQRDAIVGPQSTIGENTVIGAGAVIRAASVIGPDSVVKAGSVVEEYTVVAADTVIGPVAMIEAHPVIGNEFLMRRGATVGFRSRLHPHHLLPQMWWGVRSRLVPLGSYYSTPVNTDVFLGTASQVGFAGGPLSIVDRTAFPSFSVITGAFFESQPSPFTPPYAVWFR